MSTCMEKPGFWKKTYKFVGPCGWWYIYIHIHSYKEPWFDFQMYLKCASRQNPVHFLNISTSKSAPDMVCFVCFDFETCFALQPRALFRELNFQKWSEHEVLWPWLHTPLASLLFWTRSHKTLEKQSVSRRSYLFLHLDLFSSGSFSSDSFSSLTLPKPLIFHLSTLSEVFSKLPSNSWLF